MKITTIKTLKIDIVLIGYFLFLFILLICQTASADIGGAGGVIYYENGYTIHQFTEDGVFTPPAGVEEIAVLVVAGGGGGGGAIEGAGGGGGGGGIIYEPYFEVKKSVSVVVGDGGKGGKPGERGDKGESSSFDILNAYGGGGGGSTGFNEVEGSTGGSGGGGGSDKSAGGFTVGGEAVLGQGHDGGAGFRAGRSSNRSGGGGGGAGSTGIDAVNRKAGYGGEGKYFEIFTKFGEIGFFAGGGGGGAVSSGEGGTGGGGDGQGTICGSGDDALPNTGGGGGGAFCLDDKGFYGGNGGSGIVLVSYKTVPSVKTEGDVFLTINTDSLFNNGVTDSSSFISWAGGRSNKITVEIGDGYLPPTLELTVDTERADHSRILSSTPQNFITDIKDEYITDQKLIYTLNVVECAVPDTGKIELTVFYTITDQ